MPPLIAFAGALGGLAVVRWAYRTALRVNRNWKKPASHGSPRPPGRTIFRRCGGIPTPAPTVRADTPHPEERRLRRVSKDGHGLRPHGSRRARCAPHHEEPPIRIGIALIPCLPADTVPRACFSPQRRPDDDGRHTPAHAPGTLVPGTDPGAAALLGGLRLRDPAALRHGSRRRHLSPRDHAARARSEALERGLCAAIAAAEGWPLWRKSQPAAALLPVSGDPEAVAAGPAGSLSQVAGSDRHRFTSA